MSHDRIWKNSIFFSSKKIDAGQKSLPIIAFSNKKLCEDTNTSTTQTIYFSKLWRFFRGDWKWDDCTSKVLLKNYIQVKIKYKTVITDRLNLALTWNSILDRKDFFSWQNYIRSRFAPIVIIETIDPHVSPSYECLICAWFKFLPMYTSFRTAFYNLLKVLWVNVLWLQGKLFQPKIILVTQSQN